MNKTGDVSNPLIAVLGQYWLVDQDFARTAEGIANSLTAADIAKLKQAINVYVTTNVSVRDMVTTTVARTTSGGQIVYRGNRAFSVPGP